MSSRPIRWDKVVTPLGPKAEVVSGSDDARVTFPSAGEPVIESVVPEPSRANDKSPMDEEAVPTSSKLEKGKTVEPEQEQPPPNVATFPRMAPEELSSQAPSQSINYHLQSPRPSILDYDQDGQEPTMLTSFSQTRLTDYEIQKRSRDMVVHLGPRTIEQKKDETDLQEDLRRRWGDNYPKADQVSSSEGNLLDILYDGRTRETKQEPPDSTPKFELSLSSQTAFAADPSESLNTPDSPDILVANQARRVKGGTLQSLDPDPPLAPHGSTKPSLEAVEHIQRRNSDTEADTTRAVPVTGVVGQLIVHEPINSNHWYVQGLRTRPVFGSFPDYDTPGRTEAEGSNPAVEEADPNHDNRSRVECFLDGDLNRIRGKIEMLEVIIDFLKKQTDTVANQRERRPGQ